MPADVIAESRASKGPAPLRRTRVQPAAGDPARRRKYLNLLLGFVTIVLLVDALVGEEGLMDRLRARQAYEQASAELEALRRANAAMRDEKIRLLTDPTMIEAIAREELGLIRPGELLFIIKDTNAPAQSR